MPGRIGAENAMRDEPARTTRRTRPKLGFTLTELLVVIAIVGILIAFILIAAQDGVRRAQEKATTSLIQKLEAGLAERVEAILLRRSDISLGHQAVAATLNASFLGSNDTNTASAINNYFGVTTYANALLNQQRAQAIAQFDLVRAELPDVFFWQQNSPHVGKYPLNFAGQDFPLGSGNFLLPLGQRSLLRPAARAAHFSTPRPRATRTSRSGSSARRGRRRRASTRTSATSPRGTTGRTTTTTGSSTTCSKGSVPTRWSPTRTRRPARSTSRC